MYFDKNSLRFNALQNDFAMVKLCRYIFAKITVSGDGSWKARGHSSQIDITSVIGAETGKVLDIKH